VEGALVDAGGDLRHFGSRAATIGLRDPADPARLLASIDLRDAALASSATSSLDGRRPTSLPSALLDGRSRRSLAPDAGASVMAPSCMTADALTKIILATDDREHPMLGRHGATLVLHRPPARVAA
ncbi:MAG: FAD:protein FMN transferase, partial [Pseudomonadota bacterium]|nr:FAD:protein FMN transferase [Pseudomonadota bacterium]